MSLTLILGSASPRRQELLREAGFTFKVVIPLVEEHEEEDSDPRELVLHNASLKADYLAQGYPEHVILTADTTVALGNRVLNKPASMDDARQMLRDLSGKTHAVYTGFCITCAKTGVKQLHCVVTKVIFKTLSEDDITRYHALTNPLDKAGGYGIQDGTEIIIDHFEGSYSNVMGLPVEEVTQALKEFGIVPIW